MRRSWVVCSARRHGHAALLVRKTQRGVAWLRTNRACEQGWELRHQCRSAKASRRNRIYQRPDDDVLAERVFGVFGTGHEIPAVERDYVASTVMRDGLVWHVYELH